MNMIRRKQISPINQLNLQFKRSFKCTSVSNFKNTFINSKSLTAFELQLIELSQYKSDKTDKYKPKLIEKVPTFQYANKKPYKIDEKQDIISSNIIQINSCSTEMELIRLSKEIYKRDELYNNKTIIELIKKYQTFNNYNICYVLISQVKRLGLLTYLPLLDDKVYFAILNSVWFNTLEWTRIKDILVVMNQDGVILNQDTKSLLNQIQLYLFNHDFNSEYKQSIDIENIFKE